MMSRLTVAINFRSDPELTRGACLGGEGASVALRAARWMRRVSGAPRKATISPSIKVAVQAWSATLIQKMEHARPSIRPSLIRTTSFISFRVSNSCTACGLRNESVQSRSHRVGGAVSLSPSTGP